MVNSWPAWLNAMLHIVECLLRSRQNTTQIIRRKIAAPPCTILNPLLGLLRSRRPWDFLASILYTLISYLRELQYQGRLGYIASRSWKEVNWTSCKYSLTHFFAQNDPQNMFLNFGQYVAEYPVSFSQCLAPCVVNVFPVIVWEIVECLSLSSQWWLVVTAIPATDANV
jgi:hypothetical protein